MIDIQTDKTKYTISHRWLAADSNNTNNLGGDYGAVIMTNSDILLQAYHIS